VPERSSKIVYTLNPAIRDDRFSGRRNVAKRFAFGSWMLSP
jgi:hypothetical protein